MGKYDEVVKQFPRTEPVAGPFQEKVELVKAGKPVGDRDPAVAFSSAVEDLPYLIDTRLPPEGLAKAYLAAVDTKKAYDAAGKALNVRLAALEQLLLASFEAADLDSLTINGRPVKFDNGLSTKTVDPEAFYKWVEAEGLSKLLTMHSGRIGSITKERILAGIAIPDGIEVKSWRQAWPRSGSETE